MKQSEQSNDQRRFLLFFKRLAQGITGFFQRNYKLLITWAIIIIVVIIGIHFRVDKGILVVLVMIFGLFAEAFSGLIALLATVPLVGPIVAKVLTLPIFWIFNTLGYLVSLIAIKRGYKREVINYRFVTMVFLTGFAVGFIIAKLL